MKKLIFALCLAAGPVAAQKKWSRSPKPANTRRQLARVRLAVRDFCDLRGRHRLFCAQTDAQLFRRAARPGEKAVQEAQAAKAAAEAKFAEYQKKMGDLDNELEKLRATMKVNAEAERTRLVSEAEAAKARIERDTEAMVAQELGRAREQLRGEAAELAVKMAEEILQREMKPADQQHLVADYTAALSDTAPSAEAA